MRFLADECCDSAAVRALRADGHDVLAVNEFQHRSVDREVIELALTENRVLLTEDLDFGGLVFTGRVDSPGVIRIRFPTSARGTPANAIVNLVREHAPRLAGAFVVLRPGVARFGFGPHPSR